MTNSFFPCFTFFEILHYVRVHSNGINSKASLVFFGYFSFNNLATSPSTSEKFSQILIWYFHLTNELTWSTYTLHKTFLAQNTVVGTRLSKLIIYSCTPIDFRIPGEALKLVQSWKIYWNTFFTSIMSTKSTVIGQKRKTKTFNLWNIWCYRNPGDQYDNW